MEFELESVQKANDESNQKRAVSTTTTTLKVPDENSATELGNIERSDLLNVVDGENDVTTTATTRLESQQEATTVDSAVESNTIEPSTYTVQPIAETDVTTASGDKVDYTSDRPEDAIATTTTRIESYEFNPDLVTIVSTERVLDNASELPRRRKVILRRRPVSSTAANAVEVEEEEQKSSQVARRRKVIRRIRPIQDTSSPTSAETTLEEEAQEISSFLPESTTPMSTRKDAEESTMVTGQPTVTSEVEDYTQTGATETTLSMNEDGFTKFTLETPVPESTTTSDEGITDFLSTAVVSTTDSGIDEEYRSTSEIATEVTTAESTLATVTVDFTESDAFMEETLLPSTEPDSLSTVHAQTTSTLSTSEPDSTLATRPNFEPRYARKKFIRKNPVSRNTTDRYPAALSSTENSSLEVLSKRRNNPYIRRYPFSSTSSSTLRDDLKYEEVEDDSRDLEVGQEEAAEDTIPKSHNISDEPAPTSAVLRTDSMDFWRHYTPALSTVSRNYPSMDRLEDVENRETSTTGFAEQDSHRSTLSVNHRLEVRPRYKVPVILKRPFDPEEALSPRRFHPLDSAPEESEDTPETKDARFRQSNFRQPRTRYRLLERGNVKVEGTIVADTPPTESTTWQYIRTRSYSKRPSITTTTEAAVTETLIPAKKFDYAADAVFRKQQSLRTTTRATPRNGDPLYDSNLVDYASTTTVKPLVTRLVTSVAESGTTERQKILIKTKYSSLTSTTRVPADHFLSTTPTSFSVTGGSSDDDDESVNEIRPGVERSTLPIEGEFNYRYGRFTTESHESSTIEIESVFSNLIADKASTK